MSKSEKCQFKFAKSQKEPKLQINENDFERFCRFCKQTNIFCICLIDLVLQKKVSKVFEKLTKTGKNGIKKKLSIMTVMLA